MRLTDEQKEALNDLDSSTGRALPVHAKLEALGLVVTGRSRFGTWAKITEAGRALLAKRRKK